MGTIIARGKGYRAIVRRKRITKTKTFSRLSLARRWIHETEFNIDQLDSVGRAETLGSILQWYRTAIVETRPYRSPARSHYLRFEREAGSTTLGDMTPEWWASWVKAFACSKQSRARYMSLLASALRASEAIRGSNVDWQSYRRAKAMLAALHITGKKKARDRRVTDDELAAIDANSVTSLPLAELMAFAVDSGMRVAEICRIVRSDVNGNGSMVWVRDRKHPTEKIGNDWNVPLLGRCQSIVARQTVTDDPRIFPFNPGTVTSAFRDAVKRAGIVGLHFHDLRHEAISRLFERGYQIQEVALVSGHKDWGSLKIYTNLKPQSLHNGPMRHIQRQSGEPIG